MPSELPQVSNPGGVGACYKKAEAIHLGFKHGKGEALGFTPTVDAGTMKQRQHIGKQYVCGFAGFDKQSEKKVILICCSIHP